jgi:ABC-type antimicrobial peptide transport system permease subunit
MSEAESIIYCLFFFCHGATGCIEICCCINHGNDGNIDNNDGNNNGNNENNGNNKYKNIKNEDSFINMKDEKDDEINVSYRPL